jgi:hypothetical protein
MLNPFTCQRNIPPSHILPPIPLVDKIPNDTKAINWVFTNDITRITTISAYVIADSRAIVALEFIYDDRPILLGQPNMGWDQGSTKLSFHLASEMNEVLSGFGCTDAILNDGLSLKVSCNSESPKLTNHMLMISVSNNTWSICALWRQ